jgi:hypothetical protein
VTDSVPAPRDDDLFGEDDGRATPLRDGVDPDPDPRPFADLVAAAMVYTGEDRTTAKRWVEAQPSLGHADAVLTHRPFGPDR